MRERFAAPARVLLRLVPETYHRCVRTGAGEIDVAAAQAQQGSYWDVLEQLGITVAVMEGDEDYPDCCFIEDTAVILDEHVLVTRPGNASRQGEVDDVALWLSQQRRTVVRMEPPATLDGGDVLRIANTLFVGRSARTSDAGIDLLREVARRDGLEVVPVQVHEGLHLKSSLTLLDPQRVLCRADAADLAPLRARGIACIEAPEPAGANVLALGEAVIASDAAPRTADLIEELGFRIYTGDVRELHKGDGGLTCLSLRFPPPGCWCA
jgi:dimethylargininase